MTKRPWSPYRHEPWWIAYQQQRKHATMIRGIEWKLEPLEWWQIWESSGHWHERGKLSHQYCMARKEDKGAYEIGNVIIITNAENHAMRNRNKEIYRHTQEFKDNLAESNRRRVWSNDSRARVGAATKERAEQQRLLDDDDDDDDE
jgi:hypothetical protein